MSPGAHGEGRSCEHTKMGQAALFLPYGCFCKTGEKLCPSSPWDMTGNRKAVVLTSARSGKQLRPWLWLLQGPKHLAARSNCSRLCPWHPAPRAWCCLQRFTLCPAVWALLTALLVHPARCAGSGGAGNRRRLEKEGMRRQWGPCPAMGEDLWGDSLNPCAPSYATLLLSPGLQFYLQPPQHSSFSAAHQPATQNTGCSRWRWDQPICASCWCCKPHLSLPKPSDLPALTGSRVVFAPCWAGSQGAGRQGWHSKGLPCRAGVHCQRRGPYWTT